MPRASVCSFGFKVSAVFWFKHLFPKRLQPATPKKARRPEPLGIRVLRFRVSD